MIDLSATQTVTPGRYDLNAFDCRLALESRRRFIELMLRSRHVIYDWGCAVFHACEVPFAVRYDLKTIVATNGLPPADSQWASCDDESLHDALRSVFTGEWGPTSADVIVRMMRSGVVVDLCGTTKFGPPNPKAYLASARAQVAADKASTEPGARIAFPAGSTVDSAAASFHNSGMTVRCQEGMTEASFGCPKTGNVGGAFIAMPDDYTEAEAVAVLESLNRATPRRCRFGTPEEALLFAAQHDHPHGFVVFGKRHEEKVLYWWNDRFDIADGRNWSSCHEIFIVAEL